MTVWYSYNNRKNQVIKITTNVAAPAIHASISQSSERRLIKSARRKKPFFVPYKVKKMVFDEIAVARTIDLLSIVNIHQSNLYYSLRKPHKLEETMRKKIVYKWFFELCRKEKYHIYIETFVVSFINILTNYKLKNM